MVILLLAAPASAPFVVLEFVFDLKSAKSAEVHLRAGGGGGDTFLEKQRSLTKPVPMRQVRANPLLGFWFGLRARGARLLDSIHQFVF